MNISCMFSIVFPRSWIIFIIIILNSFSEKLPVSTSFSCFGSVSYGVTTAFPWVLVHARFCLCPLRLGSLFPPVLWKSYNQILLAFKARFSGDLQSLCQVPRLGGLMGVENLHNSGRTSLVLLFSSLWIIHSVGVGFDFIMIAPFLPSHFAF